MQEVELLVFVHHFLCEAETVQRLAAQTEYRLGRHVAALGDTAASRVAFGDEDAAILLQVAFGIVQVDAAVAQFAVVQVGLLGSFACQLCHAGDGFAFLFVFGDFLYDDVGDVRILV